MATASCVNRSADKEILKAIAQKHFTTIIMSDEQKWTFTEYLKQLDAAKFVISVDTSAIHFREGIGKPALGIYGAFTAASRTKHYQYTSSVDIVSPCPIQPCFKHQSNICPILPQGKVSAPCLSTYFNTNMAQQIENALSAISK